MITLAVTGMVPWTVGLFGTVAALAGAGAIYLSVRHMRTTPAASGTGISPQQAMALGIPLPGERSTQCGELPDLGIAAGGNAVPSRRLPTPAPVEQATPLSRAA